MFRVTVSARFEAAHNLIDYEGGPEPLHGGYVGAGMLDASVPGAIFSSPNAAQLEAATRAVDGGAGVL